MKKILMVITALTIGSSIQAQIGVGPIELVKMKAGEFSEEAISKLKASKTVFIYRESDNIEELKKAVQEVWEITEISFQPYSKLNTINLKNTSVFSIGGVNTKTWKFSGMNYDNTHLYLSLWMQGKNKKGKKIKNSYCRIELHPSYVDYANVTNAKSKDALDYIYNEGQLKNWNVGFIKNYLKNVNDLLTAEVERWLYLTETENTELKNLTNKVLYIPEYALVKFNQFTGDESKSLDEAKLFKSYPYSYKIINTEELNKKILDSIESFYYMVYVKSSTDKYITIYNGQTGSIVYSIYKPLSYNLKRSDIKYLVMTIKSMANNK